MKCVSGSLKTFNSMRSSRKWRSCSLLPMMNEKPAVTGLWEALQQIERDLGGTLLLTIFFFLFLHSRNMHWLLAHETMWRFSEPYVYTKETDLSLQKVCCPNFKLFIQLEYWPCSASILFLGWELIFLLFLSYESTKWLRASEFSHII